MFHAAPPPPNPPPIIILAPTALAQVPNLIQRGTQLFFNQTFEGNFVAPAGTCATRSTSIFTIDPAFVRSVRP